MELGARQIRTAGKGSGSIEVTLPAELRELVGLSCRVWLQDGSRPQIVLQPDLREAHLAFEALWRRMALALLAGSDEAARLPLAAFGLGLQPQDHEAQPFLCLRDGLALSRPPPHDPLAISRTLAGFGHALAPSLDIAAALAAPFGAACGYLAAGVRPSAAWQEACDLAAAGLRRHAPPGAPLQAAQDAAECVDGGLFWHRAAPLLRAAAEMFADWTSDPAGHAALRAAWRRGRSIELSKG